MVCKKSRSYGALRQIPRLVCWDAWEGAALPPAETSGGWNLITAFTGLPRSRLKLRSTCEKTPTSGEPQCPPRPLPPPGFFNRAVPSAGPRKSCKKSASNLAAACWGGRMETTGHFLGIRGPAGGMLWATYPSQALIPRKCPARGLK